MSLGLVLVAIGWLLREARERGGFLGWEKLVLLNLYPLSLLSWAIGVAYHGILPDLFREGQGVVAEGTLEPGGSFRADTVLAKHDENYMPKEVADALKKQGHWKDEYGKPGVTAGTTQ